jgi:putative addiction module component (TIGR02574 family)
MATNTDKLIADIRALPEDERVRLLDSILLDLEVSDGTIEAAWATEVRKRWEDYKTGRIGTIPYEDLVSKYQT